MSVLYEIIGDFEVIKRADVLDDGRPGTGTVGVQGLIRRIEKYPPHYHIEHGYRKQKQRGGVHQVRYTTSL